MNIRLGLFMTFATMSILARTETVEEYLVRARREARADQEVNNLARKDLQKKLRQSRQALSELDIRTRPLTVQISFINDMLTCMKKAAENQQGQDLPNDCFSEISCKYYKGESGHVIGEAEQHEITKIEKAIRSLNK